MPAGPGEYAAWIRAFDTLDDVDRAAIRRDIDGFSRRPAISLVLPPDGAPETAWERAAGSVRRQLYPHWEICPSLDAATGDYVAWIEPGDALAEHALYCIAREIDRHPDAAIVYSDHDEIDAQGQRRNPAFKPDWDPDLMRARNYLARLTVCETALAQSAATEGGLQDGPAADHAFLLRCAEAADGGTIRHVPAVLYHAAAPRNPSTGAPPAPARLNPALPVSIIVPTRDGGGLLRRCVGGILDKTDYPDYEIIVVDNRSANRHTLDYLESLAAESPRVRVIPHDAPFNFSAIANAAVARADGDIVVLLNDDVEPINPGWLSEMAAHAARPDVGAVGAKLVYPDGSLQHGGIVAGLGGVARHVHKHAPPGAPGYLGRLTAAHGVSAVTGACLATRKAVYEEAGGMDAENLPIAFNDVDFCLRLTEAGYRNVWTPGASLVHVESATRGPDDTPERRERLAREAVWFKTRWRGRLDNDPAYNPNLSLKGDGFSLAWPPRTERPWRTV